MGSELPLTSQLPRNSRFINNHYRSSFILFYSRGDPPLGSENISTGRLLSSFILAGIPFSVLRFADFLPFFVAIARTFRVDHPHPSKNRDTDHVPCFSPAHRLQRTEDVMAEWLQSICLPGGMKWNSIPHPTAQL
jgi:hypothetical protein